MINYFVTLKRLKKDIVYIIATNFVSLVLSILLKNVDTATYKENLQILDQSNTVESQALISYLNEAY